MHQQWHHAWALADSAAVCVNDSAASTKLAAGADDNLDSRRSKACEAVTLAACVLAVGSWLVGEHANAVAAVLGAVIGSCGSFLCGGEVGQNMG
jgi:hypothetical protein